MFVFGVSFSPLFHNLNMEMRLLFMFSVRRKANRSVDRAAAEEKLRRVAERVLGERGIRATIETNYSEAVVAWTAQRLKKNDVVKMFADKLLDKLGLIGVNLIVTQGLRPYLASTDFEVVVGDGDEVEVRQIARIPIGFAEKADEEKLAKALEQLYEMSRLRKNSEDIVDLTPRSIKREADSLTPKHSPPQDEQSRGEDVIELKPQYRR